MISAIKMLLLFTNATDKRGRRGEREKCQTLLSYSAMFRLSGHEDHNFSHGPFCFCTVGTNFTGV